MKKLLDSGQLGGVPIYHPDLSNVLGAEVWAAVQGMLSVFDSETEGLIISGCVFTNNAGNFDMTAGVVYLNGEFMRITAVTNQTYPKYIAPKTPVSDSRTFEDGTSQAVMQTKEAEIVASSPGAGQYITINSLTGAEDRRHRTTQTETPGLRIKVIDIGDWNMDTDVFVEVPLPSGVTLSMIRDVSVIIRNDSGGTDAIYDLRRSDSTGVSQGSIGSITTAGGFQLNRVTGGIFDSAFFDATSYNRGWVTIKYIA